LTVNSLEGNDLYEFGLFRLDLRARLLSKGAETLALAPKSFDVLAYLVRHAGRAVSREELLAAVWPDVVVSDGSLTQAVFVVRRALGETDERARFLVTVPRVGYRFSDEVSPVSRGAELEPAARPAEVVPEPARVRRSVVLAAAGGVAALAVLGALLWKGRVRPADVRSAPAPLLSLVREIAVPPDATTLLGGLHGTVVLGSQSAVYLLPSDGAQSATRVALAAGEVLADRLVNEELIVARGRTLLARAVLKQTTRVLGELPEGVSPGESRLLVSPSGRYVAVREAGGIRVLTLGDGKVSPLFRVASKRNDDGAVALSDQWLAVAEGGGGPIAAYRLPSGDKTFEAPFAEASVTRLALEDASGRLAAGGVFDSVAIFRLARGGAPETLHARGWTQGLAFIPDDPTLLVSGRLGAVAIRPGPRAVASLDAPLNGGPVVVTAEAAFVLSPARQRLAVLAYSGLPPRARIPLGAAPIWAVEHDADGKILFAGGRDGLLYAVDPVRHDVRRQSEHTDGIPSLLRVGDLLASSSDDKTVAVWQLPALKVAARTQAHAFLVNDVQIAAAAPGGPRLFTSSSDGTLKTWRWPSLEPLETVDLTRFAGEKIEAQALWVSRDGQRALVGTWNHCFLDLHVRDGTWTGRRIETASRAVYRFAALPRLDVVAGVGLHPHEVFVVDLRTGGRSRLENASLDAYWLVALPDRDELFVVGSGGALRYALTRSRDGGLEVSLWSRRQAGLTLLSVTVLPDGRLWAGTDDGALVELDPLDFRGDPLAVRHVDFR
jgi:DNA-binding winged helix-turn-helix (wHTH) protein